MNACDVTMRLEADSEVAAADRSPTDPVEVCLAGLWENVFGHRPTSVTADFFESGGHSFLAAAQLSESIEQAFGVKCPLATFMTAATLEQQASLVREQHLRAEWPVLLPIRESGSKPPLFCIHMSDGHILSYRDLIRHLPPDQPLYGLQSRGLDGTSPMNTCIEDMARDYVAEIRTAYPRGPYAICGWSFGGTVAFEMARQLEQERQRVALLALFDTHAPGMIVTRRPARRLWTRALRVPAYLRRVFFKADRSRTPGGQVETRVWQAVARSHRHRGRLPRTLEHIAKANRKALHDYVPRAYGGRVTIFKAMHSRSQRSRDPQLGWGSLPLGGLEVRAAAGTHLNLMFEPHARSLAEDLAHCLDRAWTEAEPSVGKPAAGRDGHRAA